MHHSKWRASYMKCLALALTGLLCVASGARETETTPMEQTLAGKATYQGSFDSVDLSRRGGRGFVLDHPYHQADIRLTSNVLKERVFRNMPRQKEPTKRVLEEETLNVRLPRDYDPKIPAGLVVWCSPMFPGTTPRVFHKALDELNLICVGADRAGNERVFPDRAQLMFDARENAMRRFHVDPRRVYITGMSGGGRMCGVMSICFPELFTGAVPIVGFSSYSTLRNSMVFFAKPRGETLRRARSQPIALMSGPPDFNYREMTERMKRLEIDGFTGLRMFKYPDMAHVMPTPERFLEAIKYVDEPYQRMRQKEIARAEELLSMYFSAREAEVPQTGKDRDQLRGIMFAGPFTDAAWRAHALLNSTESTSP